MQRLMITTILAGLSVLASCASGGAPVGYRPTRAATDAECQSAYAMSNSYLREKVIIDRGCPYPEG